MVIGAVITPNEFEIENQSASGSMVSTFGETAVAQASTIGVSHVDVTGEKVETQVSPADITDMIAEYFPDVKNKAVDVFSCESELDPSKLSVVDVMSDGRPFSIGLTQQNLTVTNLNGTDCSKAFVGKNKYAKVVDEQLYEKCVKLAENPVTSLETAKRKYEARGDFSAWYYCSNHKI